MDVYSPAKAHLFNVEQYDLAYELLINQVMNDKKLQAGYPLLDGILILENGKRNKNNYTVSWKKSKKNIYNYITVNVHISYFANKYSLSEFIATCESLLMLFNPIKARIYNMSFDAWRQLYDYSVMHPELVWKEYFGMPYIELFGREALLSTPCYRTEELRNGMISLQLTDDPMIDVPYEARQTVKQHLGEFAFVMEGRDYKTTVHISMAKAPKLDFMNVRLN
jgi:hypothetical protein